MQGRNRKGKAALGRASLALTLSVVLAAPVAAQQDGTGTASRPPPLAPAQQPDSGLPVISGHLRTAEQALRHAGWRLIEDPARDRALARTAVSSGQSVLARVPPLAGAGLHVNARQELEEARRALEDPAAPLANIITQLREAADAVGTVATRINDMATAGDGRPR